MLRFSIQQLFLLTALIGLLAGFYGTFRQPPFERLPDCIAHSPDGESLLAIGEKEIAVWQLERRRKLLLRNLEELRP